MNIAHVKKNDDGIWAEPHPLKKHLEDTAALSEEFASVFGNGDWGKLVGLLHDLGKYHPDWQKYLRRVSGYYDEEAHLENYGARPNHSGAGAVHIFEKFKSSPVAKFISYVIAGHHSGLPDWLPQLSQRLFDDEKNLLLDDLKKIKHIEEAQQFLNSPIPQSNPSIVKNGLPDSEQIHLWIRMLFSCLVDADFIDTEKYMAEDKKRGVYLSLEELKNKFDQHMSEKRSDNPLGKKRRAILEKCREKATLKPGFFSLTVPTGGGKTLSSMAFALEHATKHKLKRVIVAIPYTSIIEQTSKVYKYGADSEEEISERIADNKLLFGEDQVVEHHSNLDPELETSKNRLACENWDAPVIVTTNVQLFESLLGNKTSVCRKLHNLSNSVIILDEAQMLPTEYLRPIISVLNGLVKHFGVTVLLMSATQPALIGRLGAGQNIIDGLTNVREIMDNPDALALDFKRVKYYFPKSFNNPDNWDGIADQILSHKQVLCIVNTRNDCRELHRLMPEGTIHLSRFMCGEEISEIISEIKMKLKNGEQVRVVSTQLIEAGVDIDFPVVFRAMAGFDSIAQAGGRCNRENKLSDKGRVFVFVPPKNSPLGFLRKCEDAGKAIIRNLNEREITPSLYINYFEYLYSNINTFDKADFDYHLIKGIDDPSYDFRTFAEKFNMIENNGQTIVVVKYTSDETGKSSLPLIRELEAIGPSGRLMRKLQRYIVNVPRHLFNRINANGYVKPINGIWVQSDDNLYRNGIGLLGNESDWIVGDFVV